MWYTGNFVLEAIKLAEAWGFKVRTMKAFTWVKFNPLAWQRIDKAIQNSELFDYHAWGNQCPNNSIELINSHFICKE